MRVFNVGIVGTGFIAPTHIEGLRRLGQNVVGVVGSSAEKSLIAASKWNLSRTYASFDEMLADSAIQVVHITSPNFLHFSQAKAALQANKHVICEKPLAVNARETRELVDLGKRSNLVTALCYNVRYYPLMLEARTRCRSSDVGKVFHVTGSYLQDWLLSDDDWNWRVQPETVGLSRAVADIGTHWLDLVQFITGMSISEVCADLYTVHAVRRGPKETLETFQTSRHVHETAARQITTEDYGSILLKFHSGARGSLSVSQVTAGRKNCIRFDIAGAESSLSWDSEEPNTLHLGYRNQPNERLIRDPNLMTTPGRRFAEYPGGHAEGFPDTFKQLFRVIYHEIGHRIAARKRHDGDEDPPFPTFADGHRDALLVEAILKSHAERRWVTVDEPTD